MRVAALAALALAACDGGARGGAADAAVLGADAATAEVDASSAPPGAALGTFELTYYWLTSEADFAGTADTAIYDAACTELAVVPAAFADALALEGTGRLADGRMLNVDGTCPCAFSPCFTVLGADRPWGVGVQGRALVPFRSIAVDPSVIAYGTGVYLAELDGVALPGQPPDGGFVHDGCVVAADTGGGIVGQHVDFFVGLEASYRTLDGQLGFGTISVSDGGDRCADEF